MKFLLPSFFLFSCAVPAYPLEIQLTDNKIIQLIMFPDVKSVEVSASAEKDHLKGIRDFDNLGMNYTPVLDQGQYGTCVTFSTSAALDAIIGLGDFISQQCSLELFKALGNDIWNGAYAPSEVVDPLKKYGVVSQDACPRAYASIYSTTTLEEYAKIVDPLASDALKNVNIAYDASPSVDAVKKAIDAGHRVLIGFLLDASSTEAVRGFDVKIDGQKYQGGLWACKQGKSVNHCVASNAGHEVIIMGYDDEQQLFKIRNSWNVEVGYAGDYYMTYKFFESMVIDSTEIY